MIDVNKVEIGDKLQLITEGWEVFQGYAKKDKIYTLVEPTEADEFFNQDTIEKDIFKLSPTAYEDFRLVATSTKYSDIGEGDTVLVALVDEDKLRVWTEMGELIGKQGRVVYKGRMIDVDFDGVVWRFDAHELRVVFSVNGNLVEGLMDMVKDVDIDKFFPPAFRETETFIKGQADPKKATDFLSKALSLLEERGKDYDQPEGERSMGKTVTAFNAITGHNLKESDGWLILQLLKDVRQNQNRNSYHADSAEDCISYAALKAEALAEGK